jgi:hypothetical protein
MEPVGRISRESIPGQVAAVVPGAPILTPPLHALAFGAALMDIVQGLLHQREPT